MTTKTSFTTNGIDKASDKDFVISRIFNAPRKDVFRAWTNIKQLNKWWGPRGSRAVCKGDIKPGGKYRFTMIAPEGDEYPMRGVISEVVPSMRLVYSVDLSEHPDKWFDAVLPGWRSLKNRPSINSTNIITFEDSVGKTKVTVRTIFESAAERDALFKFGLNDGWNQSLDKLADMLGT